MKKIIIGIIIGIMLMLGVNFVGASISSTGVLYNSKTLNTVLDDLYSQIEEINNTGDASSSQILSGKTALVKGTKVTGTIPSYADDGYYYVGTDVGYINNNIYLRFPAGAYLKTNATGFVETWTEAKNIGLTADKIAKGQSVAGIEGTYEDSSYIGTGTTFDIKTLYPTNYSSLTAANFICEPVSTTITGKTISESSTNYGPGIATYGELIKSYDASSGNLTAKYVTYGTLYDRWNGTGDEKGRISSVANCKVYKI